MPPYSNIAHLPIVPSRMVRPSAALVTSKGVRKENSQGFRLVVVFDDQRDDDNEDKDLNEQVHILRLAHVSPPGWKVSVTFPQDPEKRRISCYRTSTSHRIGTGA